MISNNTIRQKLNHLSDLMLDVAEDMKLKYELRKHGVEFVHQAECISEYAESIPDDSPELPYQIGTADHVHHVPSGETWLVAYVKDNRLCPCGWPLSMANLEDCKLIYKATPAERQQLLLEMSKIDDLRGAYARNTLKTNL